MAKILDPGAAPKLSEDLTKKFRDSYVDEIKIAVNEDGSKVIALLMVDYNDEELRHKVSFAIGADNSLSISLSYVKSENLGTFK